MPKPVITSIQIQRRCYWTLHVRLPLRLWLFIGRAPQPRLELTSHQCAAGSWPALCQNPRRRHAEEGSGSLGKPNEGEAAVFRHTQYPLISHWCSAAVASWSTRPDSADTAADMASRRCHDDCSQQGADKPAVVVIHKFHHVHTCIVSKPKSLCVYLHQDPAKTPYNGLIAKSCKHLERIQTDLQ